MYQVLMADERIDSHGKHVRPPGVLQPGGLGPPRSAVGGERVPVQIPGLLVEADQQVHVLAVAVDPLVAHADLVHARAALDLGGVGAEGLGPVPAPGRGLGQDVARGDDPLAGLPGKPDHHALSCQGPSRSRSARRARGSRLLLGAAGRCYRFVRKRGNIGADEDDPARGPARRPPSARPGHLPWSLRHADALARWPVLGEEWAQQVEHRRLAPDESGARRPGPQGA